MYPLCPYSITFRLLYFKEWKSNFQINVKSWSFTVMNIGYYSQIRHTGLFCKKKSCHQNDLCSYIKIKNWLLQKWQLKSRKKLLGYTRDKNWKTGMPTFALLTVMWVFRRMEDFLEIPILFKNLFFYSIGKVAHQCKKNVYFPLWIIYKGDLKFPISFYWFILHIRHRRNNHISLPRPGRG